MTDFQVEENLILQFQADLDRAKQDELTSVLIRYTAGNYFWRGMHPFRSQLTDRTFHEDIARIGEGNYCAIFGWPNATVTHTGGYLGLPATLKPANMRVVDIWRRDEDHLAEDWVFIDILHFYWKSWGS